MSFQSYLDNIKEKTGKTPADFKIIALQKGLLPNNFKVQPVIDWLKQDFGLGKGHAMAIVAVFKADNQPQLSLDSRVAKHLAGGKAKWRDAHTKLITELRKFGSDIKERPTNSYISLVRGDKKFGIIEITGSRFDIGIKLKNTAPTERLTEAGKWNAMVTHRVHIEKMKQIDPELMKWLHEAYKQAK